MMVRLKAPVFLVQLQRIKTEIYENYFFSPKYCKMANRIKKGDEVLVITGDHKGKKGKILQVVREKIVFW